MQLCYILFGSCTFTSGGLLNKKIDCVGSSFVANCGCSYLGRVLGKQSCGRLRRIMFSLARLRRFSFKM